MSFYLYSSFDDQIYGPYLANELLAMYEKGEVVDACQLSEDQQNWCLFSDWLVSSGEQAAEEPVSEEPAEESVNEVSPSPNRVFAILKTIAIGVYAGGVFCFKKIKTAKQISKKEGSDKKIVQKKAFTKKGPSLINRIFALLNYAIVIGVCVLGFSFYKQHKASPAKVAGSDVKAAPVEIMLERAAEEPLASLEEPEGSEALDAEESLASLTEAEGSEALAEAESQASLVKAEESEAEAEEPKTPVGPQLTVAVELSKEHLEPFLEKNCISCHGEKKQKGDVRFDDVSWQIASSDSAQRWQDVLDVLNGGEMPPDDEPQPETEELIEVLNSLTDTLIVARQRLTDHGGETTMRRLNRREYSKTIADLFGFEISPHLLPEDAEADPFDTIGKQQFFNSGHFAQYHELGKKVAAVGMDWSGRPLATPTKQKRFQPETINAGMRTALADLDKKMKMKKEGKTWQEMGFKDAGDAKIIFSQFYHRADKPRKYLQYPLVDKGMYLCDATNRVDYTYANFHGDPRGTYRININAGIHGKPPEVRRFLNISNDEGSQGVLKISGTPERPKVVQFLKRMELGPRGVFGSLRLEENRSKAMNYEQYRKKIDPKGEWPAIFIDWMEVEGPFYDQKTNALGTLMRAGKRADGTDRPGLFTDEHVREFIEAFTYEAFRRQPAEPEFVDALVAHFHVNRELGIGFKKAMGEVISVILASPGFLYIEQEPRTASPRQLDDRSFAVRLAYFLWSRPPDDELYRAADSGALSEPRELMKQVNRMLDDSKSSAFYDGFVSRWAELDRFKAITVDEKKYGNFNEGVRSSAYKEVLEFFKLLIKENMSVYNLADSKYAVINAHLASYYGIKGHESNKFEKVKLFRNSPRGGMLGQAAFLTLGSNGEQSSPVIRGVMVLEKMLDNKPPDPPPNVPELGAGSKTPLSNRGMVELHRSQVVCASCHSRIDPIGFGLENFNAIGQWRDTEMVGGAKVPIQQGGTLVSGVKFRNLTDLKTLLRGQRHKIAKQLIESMLAYGLGRTVEFSDANSVEAIVSSCRTDNFGMRTMIHKIVSSKLFKSK